jgi:Flp pilus assembly protein TadD
MMRAVSMAPENMTYRYNLAILLDKTGRYDEAASLYRQLIEAGLRGETLPGKTQQLQERLTFISSNRS